MTDIIENQNAQIVEGVTEEVAHPTIAELEEAARLQREVELPPEEKAVLEQTPTNINADTEVLKYKDQTVTRLSYIAVDRLIVLNGVCYQIDADLMPNIEPITIRAIQWFGNWGDIEYDDATPNVQFTEADLVKPLVDAWIAHDTQVKAELKRQADELEAAMSTWDYKRRRAYPSLADQVAAIMNTLQTMVDAEELVPSEELSVLLEKIQTVKADYPKPTE